MGNLNKKKKLWQKKKADPNTFLQLKTVRRKQLLVAIPVKLLPITPTEMPTRDTTLKVNVREAVFIDMQQPTKSTMVNEKRITKTVVNSMVSGKMAGDMVKVSSTIRMVTSTRDGGNSEKRKEQEPILLKQQS